MKIEGDNIIFSTGKVATAHGGVLGLDPTMDITEGWDGGFFSWDDWGDNPKDFTKDELLELADYMINRWIDFWGKVWCENEN